MAARNKALSETTPHFRNGASIGSGRKEEARSIRRFLRHNLLKRETKPPLLPNWSGRLHGPRSKKNKHTLHCIVFGINCPIECTQVELHRPNGRKDNRWKTLIWTRACLLSLELDTVRSIASHPVSMALASRPNQHPILCALPCMGKTPQVAGKVWNKIIGRR